MWLKKKKLEGLIGLYSPIKRRKTTEWGKRENPKESIKQSKNKSNQCFSWKQNVWYRFSSYKLHFLMAAYLQIPFCTWGNLSHKKLRNCPKGA